MKTCDSSIPGNIVSLPDCEKQIFKYPEGTTFVIVSGEKSSGSSKNDDSGLITLKVQDREHYENRIDIFEEIQIKPSKLSKALSKNLRSGQLSFEQFQKLKKLTK